MKAKVYITLKKSVQDPQGTTVKHALDTMNFNGVEDVRIGKMIEIQMQPGDKSQIESQLKDMCDKLLANPVIEDYEWEWVG